MTYIIFDDENPAFEDGLPAGVSAIGQNSEGGMIFRLADGTEMPQAARNAVESELYAPANIISDVINRISVYADRYQAQFLGAESAERQARFQLNLQMAKEAKAGNASDTTMQALQLQADTQETKLNDFVDWIIAFEDSSRMVSGQIESFFVQSRKQARTLKNSVDPVVRAQFLAALKTQAEQKFLELTQENPPS